MNMLERCPGPISFPVDPVTHEVSPDPVIHARSEKPVFKGVTQAVEAVFRGFEKLVLPQELVHGVRQGWVVGIAGEAVRIGLEGFQADAGERDHALCIGAFQGAADGLDLDVRYGPGQFDLGSRQHSQFAGAGAGVDHSQHDAARLGVHPVQRTGRQKIIFDPFSGERRACPSIIFFEMQLFAVELQVHISRARHGLQHCYDVYEVLVGGTLFRLALDDPLRPPFAEAEQILGPDGFQLLVADDLHEVRHSLFAWVLPPADLVIAHAGGFDRLDIPKGGQCCGDGQLVICRPTQKRFALDLLGALILAHANGLDALQHILQGHGGHLAARHPAIPAFRRQLLGRSHPRLGVLSVAIHHGLPSVDHGAPDGICLQLCRRLRVGMEGEQDKFAVLNRLVSPGDTLAQMIGYSAFDNAHKHVMIEPRCNCKAMVCAICVSWCVSIVAISGSRSVAVLVFCYKKQDTKPFMRGGCLVRHIRIVSFYLLALCHIVVSRIVVQNVHRSGCGAGGSAAALGAAGRGFDPRRPDHGITTYIGETK